MNQQKNKCYGNTVNNNNNNNKEGGGVGGEAALSFLACG